MSPMLTAGFLIFAAACIPVSKIGERVKRTETIVSLALVSVALLTWDVFIEKPHVGVPYWYAWGLFMIGVILLGAHAIFARIMESVTANNSFEIGRPKGTAQ